MTTILNKEKILEQARIYVDDGKYDKAIAEYEKILVADPSDLRVKLRVAELYTKRKQVTEAIKIYREVAEAYAVEGFFLKAVTVLKNILRLNPTLVDINLMLAELYERMGLINDAIRQYDILATTLEHKGEAGKALEIRKKVVELIPTSESARVRYAEMLQREGRTDEAVDQYEEIAHVYEKEGRKDTKLAEMYEKILTHRDNVEMLRALCRIYEELGDKKKVLKCIDNAKSIASFDPGLLEMQAKIYAELNQIETARSKYLALAEIQKEDGNTKEAIEAYAEILVLIPGEQDRVYKRIGELGEDAKDDLKKIVEKRRKEESKKAEKEEERLKKEEEEREWEAQKREDEIKKKKETQRKEAREKARKTLKKEPEAKEPTKAKPPQEIPDIPLPGEVKPAVRKDIKEAEAVLNLARAYVSMDLKEEASFEAKKAKDILEEIVKSGHGDVKRAKEQLNEAKNILSLGSKSKPQVRKEEPPVKIEKEEKMPAKETPKKEDKKKISFV